MMIEVYDTYATSAEGKLLHFDAIVRAGTCQQDVKRRIQDFVGGDDPEIEIELKRGPSPGQACTPWNVADHTVVDNVKRWGLAIRPHACDCKAGDDARTHWSLRRVAA
tara:strand:- start:86343 stop:86666 length:324 start_codon:yes stop_codon:yes gene_type:complete